MSNDPKINLEWTDEGRSFRIVRFIDEGGMGEVYEGVLTQGGQTQRCAIKILHKRRKKGGTAADSQNLETRFHREIEILRRFDSPHIVKVVGSGYHDSVGHYYAMEYIPDGKTLATLSTDGPLPLDQSELYLRHTLEAHRKIQKLLSSLRKTVGIMVTVEARFIDIQDNFLENIGIDYRGLPAQILNVDGAGTNQNIGYRYVDAQGQNDTRAAIVNTFSNTLGSTSANPPAVG